MPSLAPRTAGALALLLVAPVARSQLLEGGARAVALGRAGVADDGGAWADANPASWATLEGRRAEIFASEAFGIAELRLAGAAAAVSGRAGAAAVAVRALGTGAYRETRVTAGAARTLPLDPARRIAVGVRADLYSTSIEGFGTRSVADVTAGAQVDVAAALRAGLVARNVAGIARADEADLTLPLSSGPAVGMGLAFRPSSAALLVIAVEKDLDFPAIARAGFEFEPVSRLALRVGATTAAPGLPARLSFGAGLRAGTAVVDLAVEWHEVLGVSPAFGLALRL